MILLVHTHACRYIYAVLQEYRVRLQVQPSNCFINVCVFLVTAVFRWLFSNRQSINWTTHILQWIQTIFSDIKSAISLVYHLMTKAHHRTNQRCDNNGLICIIIQASGPLVWKKKTSLKIHYKNVIIQNYILLCNCLSLYLSIYTHTYIFIYMYTHTLIHVTLCIMTKTAIIRLLNVSAAPKWPLEHSAVCWVIMNK